MVHWDKSNILVLVAILCLIALVFLSDSRKDYTDPLKIETIEPLPTERYLALERELIGLATSSTPRVALDKLRSMIQTDDSVARSCHSLVHEIGRAAYVQYGDFAQALQYRDELCNSGYIHGIIEVYFDAHDSVETAMMTVCDSYTPGTFFSWECFHGVGHGAMYYSNNDLPVSLALCDRYDASFARDACANGVFMENFNTDGKEHSSKYLIDDDLFFPCSAQKEHHKGDCYLYAPTHYLAKNVNEYAQALRWCDEAEGEYRETCIRGVGIQTMKENINRPLFVENICASGKPTDTSTCIEGMAGLLVFHYGALEPAREVCATLDSLHEESCTRVVESYGSWFELKRNDREIPINPRR